MFSLLNHTMMKSTKILVYDSQHYFANFLKYKFGKNFDFAILKKNKKNEEFNLVEKDFCFVFFVFYSDMDLYDFMQLYIKDIPIVVASDNIEVLKKMSRLNNVFVLDISLKKNEIADNIKNLIYNEFLADRKCDSTF